MVNRVALILFSVALVSAGGLVRSANAEGLTAASVAAEFKTEHPPDLDNGSKGNKAIFAQYLVDKLSAAYPNRTVIVEGNVQFSGGHLFSGIGPEISSAIGVFTTDAAQLYFSDGRVQGYDVYYVNHGDKAEFVRYFPTDDDSIDFRFKCVAPWCKFHDGRVLSMS